MAKDAKYFLMCFAETGDDAALEATQKAITALEQSLDLCQKMLEKQAQYWEREKKRWFPDQYGSIQANNKIIEIRSVLVRTGMDIKEEP